MTQKPETEFFSKDRGNVVEIYHLDKIIARINRNTGPESDQVHYVSYADIPGLKEYILAKFPVELAAVNFKS